MTWAISCVGTADRNRATGGLPARVRPGSVEPVAAFGDHGPHGVLQDQGALRIERDLGVPVGLVAQPVDQLHVRPRDHADGQGAGGDLVQHAVDDAGEVERPSLDGDIARVLLDHDADDDVGVRALIVLFAAKTDLFAFLII